MRSSWICEVL
jgi:hypothetical protein